MILALGRFVFDTFAGKVTAAAAGVVLLFSAWLWRHDARVAGEAASKAKTEFITETAKATEKARAKAVDARKPAAEPGAADRLRKRYCGDC